MADKKSILTLNVGSQRVGMARFAAGGKGSLQLNSYAFSELAGDPTIEAGRGPQMAATVGSLTSQFKAARQPVRYAISGQPVFSRFVKLPPLDVSKVDEIVKFEAQQNVPFPLDEVCWHYQVMPAAPGAIEVEVMLVAVRTDALTEIDNAVKAGPLAVDGADAAPLAIYNSFRYNYPDVTEPSLIIDLGSRTTNLIYAEAGRMFFRSFPTGGAAVTTAIAREFGVEFPDAEARKVAEGFVSLGGAYEEHPDPEVAAMSKIIRNTLTRVHGEIVRTNNLYKTQQGGTIPTHIFLCGGAASMGYTREFFEEKLGGTVEMLNALRNVSVGPKVDAEQAGRDAHCLNELVGLALREAVSCPVEIEFLPPPTAMARDNAARKPFLFTAAACLFGVLGASSFYFNSAEKFASAKAEELNQEKSALASVDGKLKQENTRATAEEQRAGYLQAVVRDRVLWLDIFKAINKEMKNDLVWVTAIEPMSKGKPVLIETVLGAAGDAKDSALFGEEEAPQPGAKGSPAAKDDGPKVDALWVRGLYRNFNETGAEVTTEAVTEFFKQLAATNIDPKNRLFVLPKPSAADAKPADGENDSTTKFVAPTAPDTSSWASAWEMKLPLANPIELPKK